MLGKKPLNEYIEPDFEKDASTNHKTGNKNIKLIINMPRYVKVLLTT